MTTVDLPPLSAMGFEEASLSPATSAGGIYSRYFKRFLDIALILLSCPITLPVVALCGLLVALDGHSPLYFQSRVGRHGRLFRIVKLRSMVADADAVFARHVAGNAEARAEWESYQKLRRDPRVTPVGRMLRKTSLDELPQLWNVFMGDMALVGPRPIMENQRLLYDGTAYFQLRPGITGLWQISARNRGTFADRSAFDAEYFLRLSFTHDLHILYKTIAVVMRTTGY